VRLHRLCGCPFDPHVVYGQLWCCCCCCCGGHFAVLPCLSSSRRRQPLPTSAPLLSIRGRHTVRTFPTTHWPPAMSIIPDIQPIQPPRSRSCGGQGVDGRWQMPLTMAQFCMQLTFTARCFLLSECGGSKGSKAWGGGGGGQWGCG